MYRSIFSFLKLIFDQRYLIFSMAKREVESQYIGSLLGFVWTFINPLVMILVFWFVFSVGFKVQPHHDVPFVAWLTAGMAIWFAFSDMVSGSSTIIISNASLIKKSFFSPQILPVVKVLSCLITHSVFLAVLLALLAFQNMPFSLYFLQAIYYLFCMSFLAVGLSWAVSALNVFIRDVGQIVGVFLQLGFWLTPIFWDIQIMPQKIHTLIKLNPMYYVVQGYRESFIYFLPFWHHPYQSVYFWLVALVTFILGAYIFRKLKPQFADVL
jgi:ABC-type polysaccharide/polyol phosphate export permease